ncbi:ribonuclease Z [Bacteroides sp. CAG:661]|nr:ribonuclease Z [Bacteroides sp. CAG:661]
MTPDGEVIANERLTRPSDPPRSYAYCSDTLPLASVVEQVRGADLLFHEATFVEEDAPRAKETFHTTAAQAAAIAREAGVKRLLVGHFSARYDNEDLLLEQARAVFPETMLAKETLCVPI